MLCNKCLNKRIPKDKYPCYTCMHGTYNGRSNEFLPIPPQCLEEALKPNITPSEAVVVFTDVKPSHQEDNVNPSHYTFGGIETIDYLKANMTLEGFIGFLQGNVLKYVSRYNKKNGLEDLKKAKWYLDRLTDTYEEMRNE